MNDHEKYLEFAIACSARSGIKKHGTGAVIVHPNKGKISHGWSHYSEFTMVNYRSIHAEIHALLRCNRDKIAGSTIYIATIVNANGNITLSKPCDQCLATLHDVGIKQAIFTVNADEYERLLINA